MRANDFAVQAAFALPSTAREDNPPERVDDCFVGLPLAIFPVDLIKRITECNRAGQNRVRSETNDKDIASVRK